MDASSGQTVQPAVTTRQLLVFFLPLAVSTALITVSHTLYNAGIARLSRPELYLAAFAVAKSLYSMVQFPTMTSRQCIAGLALDSHSYRLARNFYRLIMVLVLLVLAVIAFTPISSYIFETVMGNTPEVARQATISLRCFFVLPIFFIIRDSCGAVAIRLRQTYILFAGTLSRVILAFLIILLIPHLRVSWDYLIPGLFFLLTGIIEAATVWIGTRLRLQGYLRRLDQMPSSEKIQHRQTYRGVAMYAVPVLVMAFIQSLNDTFINSGLARTVSPELAIAAFAVAWMVVLSVESASRMFHQVILNFMDDDYKNRAKLRRFGIAVALVLTVLLALLGFTPLGFWLLHAAIGTGERLSRMGVEVIRLSMLMPVLGVCRQYFWGIAMKEQKTYWLTIGSVIQVGCMVLVIVLLTMLGSFAKNPALVGVSAILCSTAAECAYLYWQRRRSVRYTA